jgi:hypothetical protein
MICRNHFQHRIPVRLLPFAVPQVPALQGSDLLLVPMSRQAALKLGHHFLEKRRGVLSEQAPVRRVSPFW